MNNKMDSTKQAQVEAIFCMNWLEAQQTCILSAIILVPALPVQIIKKFVYVAPTTWFPKITTKIEVIFGAEKCRVAACCICLVTDVCTPKQQQKAFEKGHSSTKDCRGGNIQEAGRGGVGLNHGLKSALLHEWVLDELQVAKCPDCRHIMPQQILVLLHPLQNNRHSLDRVVLHGSFF